jgi:KDO2-lipid IV(A) lauroyltransferase
LGAILGWASAKTNNRIRHIVEVNLNICFPDKDQHWRSNLLNQSQKESGKTLLESLWLWRNSSRALAQLRGNIINEHLLINANDKQTGTIFVTPHFGSWEYAGLLTASRCNLMIMYAPPKLECLHEWSYRGRSSTGAQLIETTSSNLKTLVNHLKNGGSIGILPDQVPTGNGGVYAPFFSRLAYTTTIVGKLASRFNCDIVFCHSLRRIDKTLRYDTYYYPAPKELYAHEEVSAKALNTYIETCIANAPEQYLWSYKRFKRPPSNLTNPY